MTMSTWWFVNVDDWIWIIAPLIGLPLTILWARKLSREQAERDAQEGKDDGKDEERQAMRKRLSPRLGKR